MTVTAPTTDSYSAQAPSFGSSNQEYSYSSQDIPCSSSPLGATQTDDVLDLERGFAGLDAAIEPEALIGEDGLYDTYTSGGDADSSYNVEVVFEDGEWTETLQDAFVSAADYLSSIILDDLPDFFGTDDLSITAALSDIDGEGNVLGSAGPTYIRLDTSLPITGIMEFDVADAEALEEDGIWDDVVLHEMLHTLGFGALWDEGYMDLTEGSVEEDDLVFTGELANEVYLEEFSEEAAADGFDFGIPVETEGGEGTAGGHWDEDVFVDEIMTGYIDDSNFVSEMTIASLEDMGYDTVLDNPNDANDLTGTIPTDDPLASLIA